MATVARRGLHDEDMHLWAEQQADELRRSGRLRISSLSGLDWEHLADEIEELGMSKLDELFSRYKVLVWHLLKWRYQPERRSSSWKRTVAEQRYRIARALRRSPSLKPKRVGELIDAYPLARLSAAEETSLPITTFPETCPFSLEQIEDADFWPEP